MQRIFQSLLIASTVVFSWLAMQAVHEFGHVLHFGLGSSTGPVDHRAAVGVSCLLIVLIFVELIVDGWQMKG